MTNALPLILQIQQSAIDAKASLGEAFLKAKVACAKLDLDEFGKWIELETTGYPNASSNDIPEYRKIRGIPQINNPYHGWQDIGFQNQDIFDAVSMIPINTPITTLESQLNGAGNKGCFERQFSIEQQNIIRGWLGGTQWPLRLKIDIGSIRAILDRARLILTDWTIQLEKQGVLGEDLSFTGDEKMSSAKATEVTVNNFHMGDVGAFVQTAEHSSVNGSVERPVNLDQVINLVKQIEDMRGIIPQETWIQLEPTLRELNSELENGKDQKRIRAALRFIGDACTKIGTSVAASGIVHAISAILT